MQQLFESVEGLYSIFKRSKNKLLLLPIAVVVFSQCYDDKIERINELERQEKTRILAHVESLIEYAQFDSAQALLIKHGLGKPQETENPEDIRRRARYLLGKSNYGQGAFKKAIESFEQSALLVDSIREGYEHDLYMSLASCYQIDGDNNNCTGTLMDYLDKVDTSVDKSDQIAEVYLMLAQENNYKLKRKLFDSTIIAESRELITKAKRYLQGSSRELLFRAQFYEVWTERVDLEERIHLLEQLEPKASSFSQKTRAEFCDYMRELHYSAGHLEQHVRYAHKYLDIVDKLDGALREVLKGKAYNNISVAHMDFDYHRSLEYIDSAFHYATYAPNRLKYVMNRNKMFILINLGYDADDVLSEYDRSYEEMQKTLGKKTNLEMEALSNRKNENGTLLEEKAELLKEKVALQRNILVIIFILMSIVLLFYFRLKNHQSIIKGLQNKVIRGQMNPHFIGNALYSTMLMVEDKVPMAYDHLFRLNKFVRYLFQNYQADFVSLRKEVDMLTNYVEMEAAKRWSNSLTFSADIPDKLDDQSVLITPMLVQPLVENAIKYSKNTQDNHISLSFELLSSDTIKCIVRDTGIGTKTTTSFARGHSLYYIKAYNDKVTSQQSLTLSPRRIGMGTRAELLIKYKLSPHR